MAGFCADRCESDVDNNEWVGTWSLETIDGQSMEQNYSYFGDATIVANTWRFNSDGFLEGEFAVKIAPKQVDSGELEIGSIKLTGTYFRSGSNDTLSNGVAEATGFFAPSGDSGGLSISEEFSIIEDTTGTWTRIGDTLALTSEYNTSVFNMK